MEGAPPHEPGGTSNVEHRMAALRRSVFDVGRSMFSLGSGVQCTKYFGEISLWPSPRSGLAGRGGFRDGGGIQVDYDAPELLDFVKTFLNK